MSVVFSFENTPPEGSRLVEADALISSFQHGVAGNQADMDVSGRIPRTCTRLRHCHARAWWGNRLCDTINVCLKKILHAGLIIRT